MMIPRIPTTIDPIKAINHVNPESISVRSIEIILKNCPLDTSLIRVYVV